MEKLVLNVEGMMCEHCENAVKTAVSGISGVISVNVSLENKTVTVECENVARDIIADAIEGQGYDVIVDAD